jgi:hypothetical protein
MEKMSKTIGRGSKDSSHLAWDLYPNMRVEINRGTAREGTIGGDSMYEDTR